MPKPFCLEICVESVERARAAERGRADRIELCSDLRSGGITPSAGFMQTVRRHVSLPIHALIRPRAGDFCYSAQEFEIMRDDIEAARGFGMDGIVLGILRENNRVDVERTRELVELTQPLPVTFHRAFDDCEDPEKALEDVIQTGAARILTSGGKSTAIDGLSTLTRLVQKAGDRIGIMVCGGINYENVRHIVEVTSANEVHTSVGASAAFAAGNGHDRENRDGAQTAEMLGTTEIFEQNVRKLMTLLDTISNRTPAS
jgi:copper homeostasis protein